MTPVQMRLVLAERGEFPSHGWYESKTEFNVGMVYTFAAGPGAAWRSECDGHEGEVGKDPMLYSVLGTSFGGNGYSRFGFPDLRGIVPVDGSPRELSAPGTRNLVFVISALPGKNGLPIGTVMPFAGNFAPGGWLPCDGAGVRIADYPALFEALGTAFGGDGKEHFGVPHLTGAAPVGTGEGPDGLVELGQKVAGDIPGLGLHYMLMSHSHHWHHHGFPLLSGGPYGGQIVAFAGRTLPEGWIRCDGQVLPGSAAPGAYALLGPDRDASDNVAIPDLRGRMIAGLG